MTGIYTGRSPKDKYIVMDANSKDTVWWTSEEYKNDNHPISESMFISLNSDIQEWKNAILNKLDNCNRYKCIEELKRFGFDIESEAKKLEEKYLQI